MNREHLGDALDFWKGGVFRFLDLSDRLTILPMISDEEWADKELSAYARIVLDCEKRKDKILRPKRFDTRDRRSYFGQVGGCVFLDPDTGYGHGGRKHVTAEDLRVLLSQKEVELVLLYQHAHRELNWLRGLIEEIGEEIRPSLQCNLLGLDCGPAAMVFLARADNEGLLAKCRNRLELVFQVRGPWRRNQTEVCERIVT